MQRLIEERKGTKICKRCQQEKALVSFAPSKQTLSGYGAFCMQCKEQAKPADRRKVNRGNGHLTALGLFLGMFAWALDNLQPIAERADSLV